ncbi:MAG: hypothetical protein A2Y94_13835 [Caldithrix sp. RBG_13_44_9]|nr:MAG: hypothetical protein A2Y94_13835 [Caldithrix sp. RBG_13_44_9]
MKKSNEEDNMKMMMKGRISKNYLILFGQFGIAVEFVFGNPLEILWAFERAAFKLNNGHFIGNN